MGVKKIVMLAILVSFVAGCAHYILQIAIKLQPWVVAVQDVGMIRMNGGSRHGESGMQLMLNLMIRKNGKGKNAGCIWNSPGMARR